MKPAFDIRPASEADIPQLAALWHEGWIEAHVDIVPESLARLRTLESFEERIVKKLDEVRMVGQAHEPLGFTMTKETELHQLFVSPKARGTGLALALSQEFETRLASHGHERAFLYCAIGNERAAHFYRKIGWEFVCTEHATFETSEGPFQMDIWRFEKEL